MPFSVRFVGLMLALAVLVAITALSAHYHQTQIRSRLFAEPLAQGNPKSGKAAIQRYRCGACHSIPGVSDAKGSVGPPLDKIAERQTIDGRFSNDPDTMAKWLQQPKEMDPQGSMPDLGVTQKDARDMAAYLYTRR